MSELKRPVLQMPKSLKVMLALTDSEKRPVYQKLFYEAVRHEHNVRNKRQRGGKDDTSGE